MNARWKKGQKSGFQNDSFKIGINFVTGSWLRSPVRWPHPRPTGQLRVSCSSTWTSRRWHHLHLNLRGAVASFTCYGDTYNAIMAAFSQNSLVQQCCLFVGLFCYAYYSFVILLRHNLLISLHCNFVRMSEYGVELNRSLERFFVESRAIDLESLCIVAGEKVRAKAYLEVIRSANGYKKYSYVHCSYSLCSTV